MIIADLHLGKTGHFRKEGIAVPQSIYKADLQRLMAMLYFCKAERLIIAGDFSHSSPNKEMDLFLKWRKDFASLQIDLVKGNHDILHDQWYRDAGVELHSKSLVVNRFQFRHEPEVEPAGQEKDILYGFCGHVHPGIVLRGAGKQSLKFPCFYFRKDYCILPAFSKFTGMFLVKRAATEKVFAVTPTEIIRFE